MTGTIVVLPKIDLHLLLRVTSAKNVSVGSSADLRRRGTRVEAKRRAIRKAQ